MEKKHVFIIEPFHGGSHKQLIDFVQRILPKDNFCIHLYTLPAKKWHWRARTAALYFAQNIPNINNSSLIKNSNNVECDVTIAEAFLFCSSVLNLPELIALRQDLAEACKGRKIIYFHENQLTYPIQCLSSKGDRDFQYGYNQILSALTADKVLFNSYYNLNTFMDNIKSFFNIQPDFRPSTIDIKTKIAEKSDVLYFPVDISEPKSKPSERESTHSLHIIWPHRWEHDKNPNDFFECLFKLQAEGYDFKVSVLGETFTEVPQIFDKAKHTLSTKLLHFGRVESKEEYFSVLRDADVVVSTSNHEFFGVAVVEAAICGCYPLVPQRLVYPEIFDSNKLECKENVYYRTNQQMFKKLKEFCQKPYLAQIKWTTNSAKKLYDRFSVNSNLKSGYMDLFEVNQ